MDGSVKCKWRVLGLTIGHLRESKIEGPLEDETFRETILDKFNETETDHIHCERIECCTMSFSSWKSYFATQVKIYWYCHCVGKSANTTKNDIDPINPIEIHNTEKNAKYHQP